MRSSSSRLYQVVGVVIVLIAGFVLSANAEIPEQISYQGILTDDTGTPLNGEYLIRFNIYGSETGTDSLWSSGYQTINVDEGLFIYRLGSNVPIPDDLFSGSAVRYLGITVDPDLEIEQRTRFLAVPYAFHALRADTADWNGLTSVPAGFADGIDDIGEGSKWTVTDSVLYTNSYWGIARGGAGNVLYGDSAHTLVNLGVACTTGTAGSDFGYVTISGGLYNSANGSAGTIGGGFCNRASDFFPTVGGGYFNKTSNGYTTVGGGYNNSASGPGAVVGGGISNTSNGINSTVGGGYINTADSNYTTVGGGRDNIASGDIATVSGGEINIASGEHSAVSGGRGNTASGGSATIGGGRYNTADGIQATIGGGRENTASNSYATVGGGWSNTASGYVSTVGGGERNINQGDYSTIPGGYADTIEASADYSYLFGIGSKLTEDSTFMVDMPHIRFGNEASGYEFPASDGTTDQVLATDGSGQLGWADLPAASSKWVVTDSVLHTNSYLGIARGGAGNVLYGDSVHTMVNLGVICTTGTAGNNVSYVTISGGFDNTARGYWNTIGGGYRNETSQNHATIGGGAYNLISQSFATIGGGGSNTASEEYAVVGGGGSNTASGFAATVGGGESDTASGYISTIGGGFYNTASGYISTIGGGSENTASNNSATVSGGRENTASGYLSTIGGGWGNAASGYSATIGGGWSNAASGNRAIVGGGFYNTASGNRTTVGGGGNNSAIGDFATIPGGYQNTAGGAYSFAAGRRAKADSAGSFVWADSTDADFTSSAVNRFHVRASGGVYLYTSSNLSTGAYLASGSGTWSSVCDSTLKRNIREVDYSGMMDKVAALPVSQWSYKTQDESIEHVGPMAQDFHRIFGLGDDDKYLTSLDLAGVSLAAIKGLYEMNQQQKAQLEKQAEEISNLKEELLRLSLMVEGKAGLE